jgi:hypothetical protein
MTHFIDRTGQTFGSLTVVEELRGGERKLRLKCRCSCGHLGEYQKGNVVAGNTTQCMDCSRKSRREKLSARSYEGQSVNRTQTFNACARAARRRDRQFTLTEEQFYELAAKSCYYCGGVPSNRMASQNAGGSRAPFVYSGLDRVDSSKGYELSNVVPCCKPCNIAKSDMSQDQFLGHIASIYNRMLGQNSFRCCS